jgi:hypothetical protein
MNFLTHALMQPQFFQTAKGKVLRSSTTAKVMSIEGARALS